jgi:hypothetical protein
MAAPRSSFYRRVLESLLEDGLLDRGQSVLVVAGGAADRDVLQSLGFEHVTISNLDESEDAGLEPYEWRQESPHRALLELYRISRVAVVALESRDSALMRLGSRAGAVDEYELGAVAAHGLEAGGVANTSTPNYVYRWTEREVEKTIASYAPHARHRIRYFREFELPDVLVTEARGARAAGLRALRPVVRLVTKVVPRQANLFAFAIEKPQLPRDLQPWLRLEDGRPEPDERAISERYRIER